MKNNKKSRLLAVVLAIAVIIGMFTGCTASGKNEKNEPITVYMWSVALYNKYAPYIQSQLPDVDIDFIVGNNDLDFYKFLNENGRLPDIITSRRFSLHDAADLQEQLMDLSATEEAGAVYESYLKNFTNSDGTVNWLPLCGEVDGFVANRALFEQYDIPLPTDYESFVSACQEFEKHGIRGFVADFDYDYTCMEILQGLSIPEISSLEGRVWRQKYDGASEESVGLDDVIWPEAFDRLEKFIQDVNIHTGDVELSFNPVIEMFQNGKAAIIRAGGANVVALQEKGIDPVFLPYYGQNGEQWLLTYPAFQVALNKDLTQDNKRQEQSLRVLSVMLSEEGQNTLAQGGDVIAYSQNVNLKLSPAFENLETYIQQNHLYIRIASNDFFAVSRDVVHKMIKGEYSAQQAYEAFDAQLKQTKDEVKENILTVNQGYSNKFYANKGNESASVMANSLRELYGSDVLVAPAYCFTNSVIKADYTEKMVDYMVMPNALNAWQSEMSGAQLKEYLKLSVEGAEGVLTPFNRGSLPAVSGICIEVTENEGKYILSKVLKDGKEITDEDTFRVTCLNTAAYMTPALNDERWSFEKEEIRVRNAWTAYIKEGGSLAEPESYIILK